MSSSDTNVSIRKKHKEKQLTTSIQVGDILSNRAWVVLDEQAAVNTYNYQAISITGGGGTDLQLAAAFDAIASAFYVPLISHTVEYRGIQTYFLKRASGGVLPGFVESTAGASVGTPTNSPLPRNSAPIFAYNAFGRGPANRGRVYLPFVDGSFLATNGRPNNAFDVLVNSYASVLLAPLVVGTGPNTTTLSWSLIHKQKGLPPIVRGQILQAHATNKFGQMHKRGDYGRANTSPI